MSHVFPEELGTGHDIDRPIIRAVWNPEKWEMVDDIDEEGNPIEQSIHIPAWGAVRRYYREGRFNAPILQYEDILLTEERNVWRRKVEEVGLTDGLIRMSNGREVAWRYE